jgi:hypothetical protein
VWDVVDGDPGYIPEMDRPKPGKPKIMKLPPKRRRTKARVNTGGYGSAIAGALSEESLWYGPGNHRRLR